MITPTLHSVTDPELWNLVETTVSATDLAHVLRIVADAPAPSGMATLTRGTAIRAWWEDRVGESSASVYESDVARSGCDTISLGDGGIRLFAHIDEVSYLIRRPTADPLVWQVTAYCYHLATRPAPARVVRVTASGAVSVIGSGEIYEDDGHIYYRTPDANGICPGDRIALFSPLAVDASHGLTTGSLDNAAGVAGCLIAGIVLEKLAIPFSIALTDEEEGPSGQSSQTISRGAARLCSTIEPASLSVAIDIHGLSDAERTASEDHRLPWGASLAESSSSGRGSVAPPQLLAGAMDLLAGVHEQGVRSRLNVGGYVPRSDDVVAMLHSNRVLILGYPGINRHFDEGLPSVNLHDLVELAKALIVLAVGVHTGELAVDW